MYVKWTVHSSYWKKSLSKQAVNLWKIVKKVTFSLNTLILLMEKRTNEENTVVMPPHFLFPFSTESKTDGFFGLLKCIINRKSVDENCFDSSLKSAMSGEMFCIHSEDLIMDWSMLNSDDQRIRKSKLLGYWAIQNFSSLGRTLCGKTWKAPERKSIEVVGPSGSEQLQPEQIDEKIFQKLTLRILEINVNSSTLAKLKHFVKVPCTVGKNNEQQISPKIKLFDIDDGYIEKCWRALKSGVFQVNFEVRVYFISRGLFLWSRYL